MKYLKRGGWFGFKKIFGILMAAVILAGCVSGGAALRGEAVWAAVDSSGALSLSTESLTGTVATEALNVRSGPGSTYTSLGLITLGTEITILSKETDLAGGEWYRISYKGSDGFVSGSYVALKSNAEYTYSQDFESYMSQQGFPESYKPYLRQLHAQYPQWVFKAAVTGLDWTAVVDRESQVGTTLVSGGSPASWKSMEKGAYNFSTGSYVQYDSGNWVSASRQIIEYYMDPRNFISSAGIFQFLTHSYDGQTQTSQGLSKVLNNTFMAANFPEEGFSTYNNVLMSVGEQTGVNPYVLASMIIVEQGSAGIGSSISGKVSGYEGYYNFFNVGSYASGGMDAVTRGLWYASQSGAYSRPWNTRYKAILGGAEFYSTNYVQKNKNTLYFKKFNVMNGMENVGTGQYMTNVQGAESEAAALRNGYVTMIDSPMTFYIPVYTGMPDTACAKPESTGNNNNYLSALSVTGYSLTPEFSRYVTDYELVVDGGLKYADISATKSGSGASVSGGGRVYLTSDTTDVPIVVTAASGAKRTYTVTISKSGAAVPIGEPEIRSTAYTFGENLTGVDFNTSYSEFMANIKVENGTVVLKKADGTSVSSGNISTAMCLYLYDNSGSQIKTYDIVIKGDINGDGKVNSADPLSVQRHIVGSKSLKGAALAAADINGDGKVNSLDVLYMQKHIVGSYTIEN